MGRGKVSDRQQASSLLGLLRHRRGCACGKGTAVLHAEDVDKSTCGIPRHERNTPQVLRIMRGVSTDLDCWSLALLGMMFHDPRQCRKRESHRSLPRGPVPTTTPRLMCSPYLCGIYLHVPISDASRVSLWIESRRRTPNRSRQRAPFRGTSKYSRVEGPGQPKHSAHGSRLQGGSIARKVDYWQTSRRGSSSGRKLAPVYACSNSPPPTSEDTTCRYACRGDVHVDRSSARARKCGTTLHRTRHEQSRMAPAIQGRSLETLDSLSRGYDTIESPIWRVQFDSRVQGGRGPSYRKRCIKGTLNEHFTS